ncbi:hypothetical protein [Salininema proteolyticum]|uniref:Uncharacterized protein n=1 Tax=Salininema proteolyticum TaxID=1607685 RepID=A0ABV8U4C9_9ACTN
MFAYYLRYFNPRLSPHQPEQTPASVMVISLEGLGAMLWSRREQGWVYDPASIGRWMGKLENEDLYDPINRAEAETRMREITDGREGLPDEATIEWIFQWDGNPPQSED